MPCYHPLPGWVGKTRNARTGRRPIVFKLEEGFKDRPVPIPCGTCIGCQLEKARQWAVRCEHEAASHQDNCFVTLTYAPENLPAHGSLQLRDLQLFMKRLRERFPHKIRFFGCGEYGESLERPHYHVLLFGHEFQDKEYLRTTPGGDVLFRSAELEELWPYGFCSIGAANFRSAGYVARYALKKVKGSAAAEHYGKRAPEFLVMSRRPGIGRAWVERFWRDVYPRDELVVNGAVSKPPRYYDDVATKLAPEAVQEVKTRRRGRGATNPEGTGRRLVVREKVKKGAVNFLQRGLES